MRLREPRPYPRASGGRHSTEGRRSPRSPSTRHECGNSFHSDTVATDGTNADDPEVLTTVPGQQHVRLPKESEFGIARSTPFFKSRRNPRRVWCPCTADSLSGFCVRTLGIPLQELCTSHMAFRMFLVPRCLGGQGACKHAIPNKSICAKMYAPTESVWGWSFALFGHHCPPAGE